MIPDSEVNECEHLKSHDLRCYRGSFRSRKRAESDQAGRPRPPRPRIGYQSLPSTKPSLGTKARASVLVLMPVATFRTLPSIKPTSMPPLDMACRPVGSHCLIVGLSCGVFMYCELPVFGLIG